MLSRRRSRPPSLDEQALRFVRTWEHTPARERAVARFSRIGQHAAVWLAIGAGGVALDRSQRRRWAHAAVTVLAVDAINTSLKLVVRRRRPQLSGLPALTSTPTQLSFPSAHASTSFAGAFAYAQLGLPPAPLYALAAGLSWSRLYLGVHYPSDVLAGALLGSAVAAACRSHADADVDLRARASGNGHVDGYAATGSNGHVPSDTLFVPGRPS